MSPKKFRARASILLALLSPSPKLETTCGLKVMLHGAVLNDDF